MTETEYFQSLKARKEVLQNELYDICIEMANIGRKMGETREELRVVEVQMKKVPQDKNDKH